MHVHAGALGRHSHGPLVAGSHAEGGLGAWSWTHVTGMGTCCTGHGVGAVCCLGLHVHGVGVCLCVCARIACSNVGMGAVPLKRQLQAQVY